MNFFTESVDNVGFNAGDAMEGIFAIGVALYIADGYIDKNKLNSIRKEVVIKPKEPFTKTVDSNIASDGWIAQKLPHIRPGNKLAVKVIIRLKNTAKSAFGPEAKPIPNIDNSIEQMTNQIAHTSAIKRIEQFIVKVLTNHQPDDIIFYVVADGMESASSKEQIKGDVMLRVEAKSNTPIPSDVEQPIKFSIKTDTNTSSNLSVFTAILRLGNFFGLPFTKGLEGLNSFPDVGGSKSGKVWELIRGSFSQQSKDPSHLMYYVRNLLTAQDKMYAQQDPAQKELAQQKVMEYAWIIVKKSIEQMETQLKNKDETYDFTKKSFDFIEKEIFGSDMADVIKILPTSIDEISKVDFDELRKQYVVEFATMGNEMKFIGVNRETGKRDILFTLRPDIRMSPKENVMRFGVIVGSLLYKSVK